MNLDLGDTFRTIDGVTYGARPNAVDPIGGGAGHVQIPKANHTIASAASVGILVDVLNNAVPGDMVYVEGDAIIDLTSLIWVEKLVIGLSEGVTLASDRGRCGSPGALLYSDALATLPMFRVTGPNARLTGLRIRGPNSERRMDHHARAYGPGGEGSKYFYRFPTPFGIACEDDDLEIDNCEISGFSHGVMLHSGSRHNIHHNFIHHCQYNGLGYGVCLDKAAARIEYNLFDWNRHSIAATGHPECSYMARHNVVLENSLSHCFDMHPFMDGERKIGGKRVEISNNTFLPRINPIYIGAEPTAGQVVRNNWFVQPSGTAMDRPGNLATVEKVT